MGPVAWNVHVRSKFSQAMWGGKGCHLYLGTRNSDVIVKESNSLIQKNIERF